MSASPGKAARPAATICVLRDGAEGVEVVMCRRTPGARFMGGSWVFPGGAVDEIDSGSLAGEAVFARDDDDADDVPFRAAALRELVEETGIWLTVDGATTSLPRTTVDEDIYRAVLDADTRFDAAGLGYFANWVTPAVLPIRFDTRFYAGRVTEPGVDPEPDGTELDRAEWVTPQRALELAQAGEWLVPFPTRKTLEVLGRFETVDELMDHAAAVAVTRVEPKLRPGPEGVSIVLPDEPGFEELPAIPEGAAEMLARYRDDGEGTEPEGERP